MIEGYRPQVESIKGHNKSVLLANAACRWLGSMDSETCEGALHEAVDKGRIPSCIYQSDRHAVSHHTATVNVIVYQAGEAGAIGPQVSHSPRT
jgi:hypothetical protein